MSRTPWATYLWPGLPQMCRHGSWSGLAVAIGFAGLLNLGLAASLVWCELLTPGVRTIVWAAVLATWGGSVVVSSRGERTADQAAQEAGQQNDTFREASDHYLKGNWFEAERILVDLLDDDPRDVEAQLMLATLLRHTGRRDEAARHLDRLERLEQSAMWQWEIARERQRLRELEAEGAVGLDRGLAAPHAEQAVDAGRSA